VYHLESLRVPLVLRVPQFGNHWFIVTVNLEERNSFCWESNESNDGVTALEIVQYVRKESWCEFFEGFRKHLQHLKTLLFACSESISVLFCG